MIRKLFLFLTLVFITSSCFAKTHIICVPPKLEAEISDYEIIATNVGTIESATAFSGTALQYSVCSHPRNRKNKVIIAKHTGIIKIQAVKRDNFDICVKAKNSCGVAITKFNVLIDEEE